MNLKELDTNIPEEMASVIDWEAGNRMAIGCFKCGEVIFSRCSGQFVPCGCGEIFIDQTPYYCRIGGNKYKSLNDINLKALK